MTKKLILILGGARSGKSDFAQKLAMQRNSDVLYVATAEAGDEEMAARIDKHRASRPETWETLEASRGVGIAILNSMTKAEMILLDCLTLLCSNILLNLGENAKEEECWNAVSDEMDKMMLAYQKLRADWVIVSNEVGLGLVPSYLLGRVYRDILGKVNQRLAGAADEVYFMVAGLPMRVK